MTDRAAARAAKSTLAARFAADPGIVGIGLARRESDYILKVNLADPAAARRVPGDVDGVAGGFSAGGDSGSVMWRSADRAPLGLLFAGSDSGGREGGGVTFANPMATVLSVLDLQWVAD